MNRAILYGKIDDLVCDPPPGYPVSHIDQCGIYHRHAAGDHTKLEIDTHQDEEISRLEQKIDDNEVNFEIYYDMLSIQKGKQS